MATLQDKPTVELTVTLKMSEQEARALLALTEYGSKHFLEFFYKNLGEAALKPYEAGLRSLFDGVKNNLPPIFDRIDKARKVFITGRSE